MTTQAFYAAVAGISFTLLGLWWVVVITRTEWRQSPARRLLAYTVSLHFLLPGMMSILSIIAPDEPLVWRTVFSLAGALGVAGVILFFTCCSGVLPRPMTGSSMLKPRYQSEMSVITGKL